MFSPYVCPIKDLDTEMTETEEKLAQEEYEERLLPNPSTATAGERAANRSIFSAQLHGQAGQHVWRCGQKGHIARHVALKAMCSWVAINSLTVEVCRGD